MFAFTTFGAIAWLLVAWNMANPRYLSSYLLNVGDLDEVEAQLLASRLSEVQGVAEAVVVAAEGVAYLKVDRHVLDEIALRELVATGC